MISICLEFVYKRTDEHGKKLFPKRIAFVYITWFAYVNVS
jgi:hypothetical protein